MFSHDDIEQLIAEAGDRDRALPRVRAQGLKMWWPQMYYDPDDWGYYGPPVDWVSVRPRLPGRIEVYDFVVLEMLGPQSVLDPRSRWLVWARAGMRGSWRKIAKAGRCSHEKARQDYDKCLEKLAKWCREKRELTVVRFLR